MANNNNQRKAPRFNIMWMYGLILLFLLTAFWFNQDDVSSQTVPWTKFENIVSRGGVESITVYSNKNLAEAVMDKKLAEQVASELPKEPTAFGTTSKTLVTRISTQIPSSEKFEDNVKAWREKKVFNGTVEYKQASDYSMLFWSFGPIIALVLLWYFMFRRMGGAGGGGGIFSVGKSKARLFDKDNANKVTFQDVAGLAEATVEIAPAEYTIPLFRGRIP